MPATGLTYSSSQNLGESLMALSQLGEVMGNLYLKSQTAGLAGNTSVPAKTETTKTETITSTPVTVETLTK